MISYNPKLNLPAGVYYVSVICHLFTAMGPKCIRRAIIYNAIIFSVPVFFQKVQSKLRFQKLRFSI